MLIKSLRKTKLLRNSKSVLRYISHNRKIFSCNKKIKNNSVVLFELNNSQSSSIASSYLANALAMKYEARIIAYRPRKIRNKLEQLLFNIRRYLGLQEFGVFQSFGADGFVFINMPPNLRSHVAKAYSEILKSLGNKRDIEAISINDIWLGDLIYDTYLSQLKKPTIDLNSLEFHNFLWDFIENFIFWENYFKTYDVRAVNVSHCVYDLAIPLRIAIKRGIPAFQANATHIYRLNHDNLFAYGDYRYFPKLFSVLPVAIKKAGIEEAHKRIEKRFAGEVGVDMAYSTKSAYGIQHHEKLLQKSSKKKILIATHCFFDSPHSYGNNLFPDFYEWLDFLGKITVLTDYDWYIKTHPDYLPGTKEVIDDFVARYPKFNLLPANASHHQIIDEGIDFALTVYGTIGFEYAALGIPVINCSINNPHIAYDFNHHPKSINEYEDLLLNLDNLKLNIDKEQVYEYYFMRNIYNTENLFFDNYNSVINDLGGYYMQFTDAVYDKWLAEWTSDKHQSLHKAINIFIGSNDFRMEYRHFGRPLTPESLGLAL